MHTFKGTQSNKEFCHVGPYMNDLSQEFVQANPLDSIRYSMKKYAACQLNKLMQIDLARLIQQPHDIHHMMYTTQGMLQLSLPAACTSSDIRMQEHNAKKRAIGK